MKKRLIALLLALTLAFAVLPCMTGACYLPGFSWEQNGPSFVEMTTLRVMVNNANRTIDRLVKTAIRTPYDDTAWLLRTIDAVVKPVMLYADYIGATVVCEYDYITVDGKVLAIDPLRVVNI